ncbi:MAG: GntR family transcriptional regulator [Actinomycetaceae bacterium]|nr:GntR family transcriptional regulator [Actinomycetaceae bacterium]
MHFDSVTPIYIQIADDIRTQILTGTLKEGDQVMSTTAYATTYRINPATAAKAFAQLIDDQLLEKRRGIGMFVRTGARERLRERGRSLYWEDTLDPALDKALSLGLDEEALIDHIRTYLRGQRP